MEDPAQAQHLPNPSLSVWTRLSLRSDCLQNSELRGMMRHQLDLAQPVEWSDDDFCMQPIRGWARALRLSIAILLLLPLSLSMVFALMLQIHAHSATVGVSFFLTEPIWFTLLGAASFLCLMFSSLANPLMIYLYVLGHEATHALTVWLCLGKVSDFKFGFDGGYVDTDKDNFLIALSPYFVPLWMVVWMLLFCLVHALIPFESYERWFYAGFGFWWVYHIYWTLWVIPREQPDLMENGLFFSSLLILLMNMVVLLGVLWAFDVIDPLGYAEAVYESALHIVTVWQDIATRLVETLAAL